jgi:kynurenine formamidase
MAALSTESWESIPWVVQTYLSTPATTSLYYKASIPYTSTPNALQNLSIWVPAPPNANAVEIPSSSNIPCSKAGIWVIYIHGGAWRDPLVTANSFTSTVTSLATYHSGIFTTSSSSFNTSDTDIAGIASINYSLTPKTSADAKNDTSRRAKHPDHILDVLTALAFLQAKAGFGESYILLGHSCGATLALQVAMGGMKRWICPSLATSSFSPSSSNYPVGKEEVKKPIVIVGLNGLYDMPGLIRAPGEKHQHLQALYEDFTRRAFGDDEAVWKDISPASVEDWGKGEWIAEGEGKGETRKIVLVQSKEDSLVPYWQLEDMRDSFSRSSRSAALEVRELEAGGDHNDLWKEGSRLAEIVVDVVQSLRGDRNK